MMGSQSRAGIHAVEVNRENLVREQTLEKRVEDLCEAHPSVNVKNIKFHEREDSSCHRDVPEEWASCPRDCHVVGEPRRKVVDGKDRRFVAETTLGLGEVPGDIGH